MNKKALSKLPSELSGQRTLVRDESSRGTPTTTDTTPQSALPPDKATPRAPSREDSNKKDNEKDLGQSSFNVPDGTAKEIKTRTIPTEGEQYGHPYQDGVNNLRTRVNQRTASPEWVADMYLGELDFEAELDLEAEDIEAAKRWMGGIRPSKGRTRRRPRSVMNRATRLRNRGGKNKRHKYRYNPSTRKTERVKRTQREILLRQRYDRDYELRRRGKTPSGRKKQRGFYKPKPQKRKPSKRQMRRLRRTRRMNRRAFDMNLEAIQNVMAEMGLYEIRPPDTDELYTPSGVPYSPSGGNGYWKRDLPNRERRPSEKQDTSREPSDAGNSSRVVPQGQYVKATIRVAYRFLNGE